MGLLVAFGGVAVSARAQTPNATLLTLPVEKEEGKYNALEVGLGAGLSLAMGDIGVGTPAFSAMAGPGAGAEIDIGWRINPRFLLGVYTTGSAYSTRNTATDLNNMLSATLGLQGNYHLFPDTRLDAWLGVGFGWRGYWANGRTSGLMRHGLELLRFQAGVDLPVMKNVTLAPFFGLSASMFLTQQRVNESSFSSIPHPKVNLFLGAGVLAHFDVLGRAAPVL